ncbi:glycine/D-amino acid oxidase-like deaminating enzyme [Bacillus fengqiuensis]|nr:glycine/D-amino acid oxidase-like deaminating enzyme [Bacillus fengqiuensis]
MMFLHTGNLYWPRIYEQKPMFPALEEDVRCDVLIVGGGISGAYSAYHLAETGLDVVVIDKRRIGSGSTSANTGLLQFSNDKTLTSCIHSFGEDKAVRHYKLCEQAIKDINTIVQALPLDVDFIPRSSLYAASCPEHVSLLKEEYAVLCKHGFSVEYWTEEQIKEKYGFKKPAALYTKGDAEVNPYKLTYALIQKAAESGVRVYEHTSVIGKTFEDDHVNILTHTKRTIRARKVVFAAGYEAQSFRKDSNAKLSSTFAIATNPLSDFGSWHERSLIWETSRPYLYVRTTVEGRVIIGGLDERRCDRKTMESSVLAKRDELLFHLKSLFPQYDEAEAQFFWGGVFGDTHDGLPIIGAYDDILIVISCSVMGETGSFTVRYLAKC